MTTKNHYIAIVEYGVIAPALYTWKNKSDMIDAIDRMIEKDVYNHIVRVTFKIATTYNVIQEMDISYGETVYFERETIANAA